MSSAGTAGRSPPSRAADTDADCATELGWHLFSAATLALLPFPLFLSKLQKKEVLLTFIVSLKVYVFLFFFFLFVGFD